MLDLFLLHFNYLACGYLPFGFNTNDRWRSFVYLVMEDLAIRKVGTGFHLVWLEMTGGS